MDKLEFTYWSQVNRIFGFGEIAIFRQRMIIRGRAKLSLAKLSPCLFLYVCRVRKAWQKAEPLREITEKDECAVHILILTHR